MLDGMGFPTRTRKGAGRSRRLAGALGPVDGWRNECRALQCPRTCKICKGSGLHVDTPGGVRNGSGEENPKALKESLGRKLLRLLLQFCACLILLPAVFGGLGALVGLFVSSPLHAMFVGLSVGMALGGIGFVVLSNYYISSYGSAPGGYSSFGGGIGDGGGGDGGGA